MQSLSDLFELMPEKGRKDCEECGLSTCRAFARRLVGGDIKLERCPYVKSENKKKIKKMLKEGVQLVKQVSFEGQEGVALIHPCATDATKVSAEAQLVEPMKYGFLDIDAFAPLVESKFKEVRCSDRLGIAKFKYGARDIIVYSSGKVNIKRCKNKKDIEKTLDLISRMMWPATICKDCGSVAMECAVSGCNPCKHTVCPVLRGGPPKTKFRSHKVRETKVSDAMEESDIKSLLRKVKSISKWVNDGKNLEVLTTAKQLKKAGLEYTLATEDEAKASLGIVFMGIANALSRIDVPLTKKLVPLFDTAIQSLLDNDRHKAFKNLKACKEIKHLLKEKDFKTLNQIEMLSEVLDLPLPA